MGTTKRTLETGVHSWVRYYCLRAAWQFAQLFIHCVCAESLFESASLLVEMLLEMLLDIQHQRPLLNLNLNMCNHCTFLRMYVYVMYGHSHLVHTHLHGVGS